MSHVEPWPLRALELCLCRALWSRRWRRCSGGAWEVDGNWRGRVEHGWVAHGGTCAFITATANLEVRAIIHVQHGLTERIVARRSRSHSNVQVRSSRGRKPTRADTARTRTESKGDDRGSPN